MDIAIASQQLAEFDGGSQRSLRELAERLVAAGHRVTAIGQTVPPDIDSVRVDGVSQVVDALAGVRPDIALTQLHWSPAVVGAARRLGIPSVFFSRLGECLMGADLVVFNSQFCARRFPQLEDSALVVPPVIDCAPSRGSERPRRWEVTMVNPIALKGGARLAAIARATPELAFRAIGGWCDPAEDGVDLRGIHNLVHTSAVSDLRAVWATSLALVFPSVWPEPAGRVIIEAFAAGVPVVASGTGGSPEMLGSAGIIVSDPDDPECWSHELRRLARNPDVWQRRSAAARARARAYRADTKTAVDALMERITRLSDRGPRPYGRIRLLVPDELLRFPYLTEHVFDVVGDDFVTVEL